MDSIGDFSHIFIERLGCVLQLRVSVRFILIPFTLSFLVAIRSRNSASGHLTSSYFTFQVKLWYSRWSCSGFRAERRWLLLIDRYLRQLLVSIVLGKCLVELVFFLRWAPFVIFTSVLLEQADQSFRRCMLSSRVLNRHDSTVIKFTTSLSFGVKEFLCFHSVRMHELRNLSVYFLCLSIFEVERVKNLI